MAPSRKILLTGGAGFIGSHLAEALLARGEETVILDDFNDYYAPDIKEENLRPVRADPRLTVVRGDIRDRVLIDEIFSRHRFSAVIHLAARAGVLPSLQDPVLYQGTNVDGTLNLLEAARKAGVGRFVFASSSSVYGDQARQPLNEDEAGLQPVSPYGTTKLTGEHLCRMYQRLHRLPVSVLRFFTVYGPRQRPDMAIHKFSRLIWEGKEIPVFGDGSSRRDYTFVDDIVAGVIVAWEKTEGFGIFNLAGGHPVALRDLLARLGSLLGRPVRERAEPLQKGDMKETWADVGKARRLLGFQPRTPIEAGLERFVAWFRERRPARR
jgi:UDP-glucuronate 4-epimerase